MKILVRLVWLQQNFKRVIGINRDEKFPVKRQTIKRKYINPKDYIDHYEPKVQCKRFPRPTIAPKGNDTVFTEKIVKECQRSCRENSFLRLPLRVHPARLIRPPNRDENVTSMPLGWPGEQQPWVWPTFSSRDEVPSQLQVWSKGFDELKPSLVKVGLKFTVYGHET